MLADLDNDPDYQAALEALAKEKPSLAVARLDSLLGSPAADQLTAIEKHRAEVLRGYFALVRERTKNPIKLILRIANL